jgi:hypothetical protein
VKMLRWYMPAKDLLTVIGSFAINGKWRIGGGSLRSPGTGTRNDPSRNLYDDLVLLDLARITEGGHWPELFWEMSMKINDAVSRAENEFDESIQKPGSALKKQNFRVYRLQSVGIGHTTGIR